jgi:hypothetical protein
MTNQEYREATSAKVLTVKKEILSHIDRRLLVNILFDRMKCGCQRGCYLNQLVGGVISGNITVTAAVKLLLTYE